MPAAAREWLGPCSGAACGGQPQGLGAELGHAGLATTTATDEHGSKPPGASHGGFFPPKPAWPAHQPAMGMAVANRTDASRRVTEAGDQGRGAPLALPGGGP